MSNLDAGEITGKGENPLSEREMDVLERVGRAMSNDEIAADLGLAKRTVHNHVYTAMRALGAKNRFEAYLIAKPFIESREAKSA